METLNGIAAKPRLAHTPLQKCPRLARGIIALFANAATIRSRLPEGSPRAALIGPMMFTALQARAIDASRRPLRR